MFVGIDLGGMSAKAACAVRGKLRGKTVSKISDRSPEAVADLLAELVFSAVERAGFAPHDLEAAGLGAPGIVRDGKIAAWTNFGWKDVPLAEMLSRRIGKEVFLLNDANAAALGEARYGGGKGYPSSILITLGTGVGGGIVLGGKLFEGYMGAGAEIGHMTVMMGGRKCSCGRYGCLETYVSTRALVSQVEEEAERHPSGTLAKLGKAGIDGKTLFTALERGDPAANRIFGEYIAALGEGVLNLVNLFRPQAVLIGGGISAQGETLIAPLREYVLPRLMVSAEEVPLKIAAAKLGNDAGIFGAAASARARFRAKL